MQHTFKQLWIITFVSLPEENQSISEFRFNSLLTKKRTSRILDCRLFLPDRHESDVCFHIGSPRHKQRLCFNTVHGSWKIQDERSTLTIRPKSNYLERS